VSGDNEGRDERRRSKAGGVGKPAHGTIIC
jgi:hypothetical protein